MVRVSVTFLFTTLKDMYVKRRILCASGFIPPSCLEIELPYSVFSSRTGAGPSVRRGPTPGRHLASLTTITTTASKRFAPPSREYSQEKARLGTEQVLCEKT